MSIKSEPPRAKARGFSRVSEAKPRTVPQVRGWCWGKLLGKRSLHNLICFLLIILLTSLLTKSYFDLKEHSKVYTAGEIGMVDLRMTSPFFEINNFPRHTGNDILFLSKLPSLKDVISSNEGEFRNYAIGNLEKVFLEFLKGNPAYYQLRYLNETGKEIVRVDFYGDNNYKIVPKDELQDKKHRYYFSETIALNKEEVFISPLDLNIEHSELENRGTKENPKYVPVMRYATPVFSDGEPRGMVISNTYADYFLDDIRRSQRESETIVLINNEGYYLAHPDREKEFAFMLEGTDNFFRDYPEVSKEILLDSGKKRFESDNLIFSFKRVYPTAGNFGIHKASEKIFGENPENNYFWVMVSISKKSGINKAWENSKGNYLFSMLFSGTIILIVVTLVFIIGFKIPDEK